MQSLIICRPFITIPPFLEEDRVLYLIAAAPYRYLALSRHCEMGYADLHLNICYQRPL